MLNLFQHLIKSKAYETLKQVQGDCAVLFQRPLEKRLTKDIMGTRYRIEGPAKDGRRIHVICRFKEDGSLIIITVYALMEKL